MDKKEEELKYPEKEYKKTIFSFTSGELRRICSFDTVINMGQMASVMLSQYINTNSLKRVGVRNSPDIGLVYDVEKGEFYVYEPKFWCTTCQIKKAIYSYNQKSYCQTCFDILKEQSLKKEKKKEGEVKK